MWLKLRPLAYQAHPYKWATIGKEIAHIEDARMVDVKNFFRKHYSPANAILVVAGSVSFAQAKALAEKWFGPIPAGQKYDRQLAIEPPQRAARHLVINADVPLNALYKTYHMPGHLDKNYYAVDLLSDILGRGKSSRLYHTLVKEKKLFNSIGASVTASIEPGLLVIQGKLNEGISCAEADAAVESITEEFRQQPVDPQELIKVKNQAEASIVFSEVELLNRAMNLAYSKLLGNANFVNEEGAYIQAVTANDILYNARQVLDPANCSTLYYQAKTPENSRAVM